MNTPTDDKVVILVVERQPSSVVTVEGGTTVIATGDSPSILIASEQGPAGKPGEAGPAFTGAVKLPIYTLTTLPSASANTNACITVSNATGGPAVCISNGTNWINVRTNATVA